MGLGAPVLDSQDLFWSYHMWILGTFCQSLDPFTFQNDLMMLTYCKLCIQRV